MATRSQVGKIGLRRSNAAAERSSHAAAHAEHGHFGENGGAEWLDSNISNDDRRTKPHRRAIGGLWVQVAYALIDVVCVLANGAIAFLLRFSPSDLSHFLVSGRLVLKTGQPLVRYGAFLFLYVALILLFCQLQDLYRTPRDRSISEETFSVVKAVSFATLLLTAFIYLSGVKIVARSVVLISLLLNALALASWRYAKRKIVIHRVKRGIGTRNAIIVGAGRVGQALAHHLEANHLLGYCFKGFVDSNHSGDPRTLGKIDDLGRIARAEFADDIFITIPSERELVKRIALEAQQNRLAVKVIPELYDGLAWLAPLRRVGDFPVMDLCWNPIPTFGLFLKRLLDLSFSAVGLVLCFPVLLISALWVKLDSTGPVLYRAGRAGKKGRLFTCYKLRTMVANADALKHSLRCRNERQGPFFKIADDPRVTRAGRFLRRYSLDELPQLWNVLKGDMSLVGPRPHPVDDYEKYSPDDLQRLEVKPGITGLWQVTARTDPSFQTSMELDIRYIETWSLRLDISVLLRTFQVVIDGEGS